MEKMRRFYTPQLRRKRPNDATTAENLHDRYTLLNKGHYHFFAYMSFSRQNYTSLLSREINIFVIFFKSFFKYRIYRFEKAIIF